MLKAVKRKLSGSPSGSHKSKSKDKSKSSSSSSSPSPPVAPPTAAPASSSPPPPPPGMPSPAPTPPKSDSKPDQPPMVDTTLPAKKERRRSSVLRQHATQELKDLPLLRSTSHAEHSSLFKQKLGLCSVCFNFDDHTSNARGKELKRQTLLEIVDYVNSDSGQKIFGEPGMMECVIEMISSNIFRALPPQQDDFDPEEDEPVLETAWPHLQVVYEFLLRFVVSRDVQAKLAKKHGVVDHRFCLRLIELFDSEDPRERDYLKTILHRVYGKFMSHRSFIRKQISFTFQRFVYETEQHNGIGELLEILGSIINGFALPLKAEHQNFLRLALIPLHKPRRVSLYHQQLSYCVVQYVEKDPATAIPIVNGIIKYWPWANCSKQVMFLNELEEVLETVVPQHMNDFREPLLDCLARCINSEHFQVVERTLFLWNNDQLVTHCLANKEASHVLPKIFDALERNASEHWNPTVKGLAEEVSALYKQDNGVVWKQVKKKREQQRGPEEAAAADRDRLWKEIRAR